MANPKYIVECKALPPKSSSFQPGITMFMEMLNNAPEGYTVDGYLFSPETADNLALWQVIYKEKPKEIPMETTVTVNRKFKGD